MSDLPTDPTPELPELPPEFGLPVDHLFMIDPLELTDEDLLLLAQHYRASRLNFIALEAKPKSVEYSRGPKMDPVATKAKVDNILASLIGGGSLTPEED